MTDPTPVRTPVTPIDIAAAVAERLAGWSIGGGKLRVQQNGCEVNVFPHADVDGSYDSPLNIIVQ